LTANAQMGADMSNPFAIEGDWFKGNLHTHTTESDGAVSPQEAVAGYATHGYDFLSITDHRKVTDISGLDSHGMLLIPGIEMNGGQTDLQTSYHVVAIGAKGPMQYDAEWDCQRLIDYGNQNAEFVFIAHPAWSSLTLADVIDLEGYIGVEVYNTGCHYEVGRGDSGTQWDDLLARGKKVFGFAVDDAHFKIQDAWVGYIMVKAAACNQDEILAAVKAGHFYASTGPQIHNLEIDGNRLLVECSPCWEVRVICPLPGRGTTAYRAGHQPPHTSVELDISPGTVPFRIECLDEVGNKAWSNPIWIDK
jgi:hypothetical protein